MYGVTRGSTASCTVSAAVLESSQSPRIDGRRQDRTRAPNDGMSGSPPVGELHDARHGSVRLALELGVELDRVVAVERVDHLDVPRPAARAPAPRVGDAQVEPPVLRQLTALLGVEPAAVDRVDERAGRVPRPGRAGLARPSSRPLAPRPPACRGSLSPPAPPPRSTGRRGGSG